MWRKLFSILALLMTAATGAWATDGIDCSASDIGKVLCTDGSIYATVGDATTANKTAAAMIVYIDETNMKGLALALKDESSMMSWTYASSLDGAADHKPTVTGGTWKLASQDEWNLMINAAGGYATLRDGFSAVGGDNLKSDNSYWSSTKESSYGGKEFSFASGEWGWAGNYTPEYVRACLTFDIVKPAPTYTVSLKEGTEDADKWTINPNPAAEGQTVTATYSGTRRVKSVKAVKVEVIPVGAIKGKFTINNTGKQVYFAKGNLQAVCTSADNNPSSPETFTWQFAENQWDCVGNNAANNSIDGNGSVSAAGTVDLFGWSTAATTYGIHNSTSASDYSGDFVDWGGIIGTGWRTLTKDEWNYLFMTRESGSKVNGMSPSPDNARYTHATINTDNGTGGIRGMILFPDGVTVNYSDATSWGGINQYSNWNGSTKCTTSQWNALAAKGFVFLPTGGVRNGTTISNSNNNGYYWSSYTASPTSGYAHYTRVVPTTEPTTASDSRKIGISVRLVYEVATTDAEPAAQVDPLAVPMTIEAITAGSIIVANPKAGMQFSLDGGKTKNAVTTDAIPVAAGDKVQFYGNGTSITCYGDPEMSKCTMINGIGDGFTCKVYGNIMSLLDEENFAKATTLSDSYTFKFLFYNNFTLTDASGLLLPAETLQESCYREMFSYCSALTAAPALPATQLAAHCYREMFNSCSALTAAPVLPAKKLVMYCYQSMFNYCVKLATVTCLATSGIAKDYSTSYWLNVAGSEAEGTKTFNAVSSANWPSGDNGIPSGWTRVNIDN